MRLLRAPVSNVASLQFGPGGRSLYLYGNGAIGHVLRDPDLLEQACRLDIRSGEVTGDWRFSGSECVAYSPDFRLLYHSVSVAVAGGELDLRRVDLLTGRTEHFYSSSVIYPSCLAFTPNGHILAIGGTHYWGGDGLRYVHRLDVWHKTELDPFQTEVDCLAYSPDGHTLAVGSVREGMKTYQGKRLAGQWPGAACLAWSGDGRLAWGCRDGITLARPGSADPARVWPVIAGDLAALDFSSDGRLLLAGSLQGTCCLLDAAGGVVATLDWGIGPIHSVAFSPDGLTCAAGGENGQVVVWDVDA